ncbi:hypothetical protein BKA70DRAFT_1219449 [Coprinopsis sp. MPI-PUGE-AT-0042]|nr:hypothetical protein BKA70DRAFT_1219449 [Coprinopsis sp. MPI-PUGE-AT-0042]
MPGVFELPGNSEYVCKGCDARYSTPRHLDAHEKERCYATKRRLSALLGQTKSLWEARKRRRLDKELESQLAQPLSHIVHNVPLQVSSTTEPTEVALDDDAPISRQNPTARSTTWKHREPVASNHGATLLTSESCFEEGALPESLAPCIAPGSLSTVNRWWQSKSNKFSLWRRCYGQSPPTCDPEQSLTVEDLDDSQEVGISTQLAPQSLGPFPNLSSFLFADWWWNGGNDKSGKELEIFIEMGKKEGFSFQDVLSTNWKVTLDALDSDEGNGNSDDWFDDANWVSTPITIAVPFHRYMKNAGAEKRRAATRQSAR